MGEMTKREKFVLLVQTHALTMDRDRGITSAAYCVQDALELPDSLIPDDDERYLEKVIEYAEWSMYDGEKPDWITKEYFENIK